MCKILMATYDSFSTTGILLDCGTIAYIFTSKQYFLTYINFVNKFITIKEYNCALVIS